MSSPQNIVARYFREAVRSKQPPPLTPMSDMPGYMDELRRMFLTPYPSISDSVGVDRKEIVSNMEANVLVFHGPHIQVNIVVSPTDGTHMVTGHLHEAQLHKAFKFNPSFMGMHRGTQGDINHYLENMMPVTKLEFQVVGDGPVQVFKSLRDLTQKYHPDGAFTGSSARKELQGLPTFDDLVGPMHNGRHGDVVTIRYETPAMNDLMSRAASGMTMPREFYVPKEVRNTPPMRKTPHAGWKGEPSITLTSYSSAQLWDGKPKSETDSMYGH